MNEKPILFHTYNGKEFDNLEIKMFLENNNIKYIKSAPYHPQSNGCCEALHKEIKKFLLDDLEELKENFDIDVSIENAINFHNNRELSSTGYRPGELRNIADKKIINEVVENIVKSMKRKIDKFQYCVPNTLLLITNYIILKGKRYILKNLKGKKSFIIPVKLVKYINDDTISVSISINYDSEILKKHNIINIKINCCRIIDDYGYSYYMELYGEKITLEERQKLMMFEN